MWTGYPEYYPENKQIVDWELNERLIPEDCKGVAVSTVLAAVPLEAAPSEVLQDQEAEARLDARVLTNTLPGAAASPVRSA